ncbi:MAG: glycosyltransferase [Planctomycetota bacterium]|nr:glycosyltransferase [Planctomycetota bacterium]
MTRPGLRVLTASWPGKKEPWRARFIRDLHLDLAADFDTELIAPQVHREDSLEEQDGPLQVRRFRYRSGGKSPRNRGAGPIAALSWLISAHRESRKWRLNSVPGVVLAHWAVPAAVIARQSARRLNCPLIVWCHGSDVHRFGRTAFGSRLLRIGLRSADRVLAASEPMARELQDRHGIPGVEVLPLGIDSEFLERGRSAVAEFPLKLLWVGERIASKGYLRMLVAVDMARKKGVPLSLEVIGGGSNDFVELEQGVEMRGPQPPAEILKAMDRSHLLLLPSMGEGTPLVVQEAIARGLPVASTPVGGIPDLFPDGQGWFPLEGRTDNQISSRLAELIGEVAEDEALLARSRESLLKRELGGFSRQRSAEELRKIVSEVLR